MLVCLEQLYSERVNPNSFSGPRRCLGEGFASTVMAYTIVRILQSYERIEPGPSQDESKGLAISVGFVGFNMGGVKVRLFPAK